MRVFDFAHVELCARNPRECLSRWHARIDQNRRNEEMVQTDIFLWFVLRYRYQIISYVYRPRWSSRLCLVQYRYCPNTNQVPIRPTVVGGAYERVCPGGWGSVATADSDGDGNPDFLLDKPSTGETAIWYLNKSEQ
jgi:hypothetical protein